ncbi:MAG: DUF1330 domain-containing protein [Gammaproteobacteria bacterium]|nr:DUF1330 domain-containing protein [Gammaproteobacteria bacterium]
MSRPLIGFLLFCVILGGTAGLAAWFVGPAILSLALDEKQRNEPYYLLHFAALKPGVKEDYTRAYEAPMQRLVVADGGHLLWRADMLQLVEGSVRDEWTQVVLVRFPRAAEFVQMITSSEYRHISAANPVERVVVGIREVPDDLARDAVIVLYLFRLAEAAADGFRGMARKMVNLEQYGGLVVWETAISMIEGKTENWDRLIALRFETVERAESWLRDPVSVTERAIARRNMQQVVVLLLQGERVGGS